MNHDYHVDPSGHEFGLKMPWHTQKSAANQLSRQKPKGPGSSHPLDILVASSTALNWNQSTEEVTAGNMTMPTPTWTLHARLLGTFWEPSSQTKDPHTKQTHQTKPTKPAASQTKQPPPKANTTQRPRRDTTAPLHLPIPQHHPRSTSPPQLQPQLRPLKGAPVAEAFYSGEARGSGAAATAGFGGGLGGSFCATTPIWASCVFFRGPFGIVLKGTKGTPGLNAI